MPILVVAGAALVVISLLQVIQTSEATTASFAIQRLEQEKLEAETSVRELEADVAGLSSLARIEREARRLGLVAPEEIDMVSVNVAWTGADEERLPTRFRPEGVTEADGGGDSWWQNLLSRVLPFD